FEHREKRVDHHIEAAEIRRFIICDRVQDALTALPSDEAGKPERPHRAMVEPDELEKTGLKHEEAVRTAIGQELEAGPVSRPKRLQLRVALGSDAEEQRPGGILHGLA